MSREKKLWNYDPNDVGITSNNIFGLPFETRESKLVFVPVPWDVTTSDRAGTAEAPGLIFRHSFRIDLFDPFLGNVWKQGMAMEEPDQKCYSDNKLLRQQADLYISFLESGGQVSKHQDMADIRESINHASDALCDSIEQKCLSYLNNNQIPFIVGGDHSVPLGLMRALGHKYEHYGILQIDAHADLRNQYLGFTHSHASIMHNALDIHAVSGITQVGVREWCEEEARIIEDNARRIHFFSDSELHQRLFSGTHWHSLCEEITDTLPDKVYVSFDIDGLCPSLCPNTGTPVPGGLTYNQAIFLLETIVRKGKTIIGADLVETGGEDPDAMTGCRLLYKMAGLVLKSND
jgi:agmatinase